MALPESLLARLVTVGRTVELVLHAGTSKTGTSSLQVALQANYNWLLGRGILYPQVNLHPHPPKHQWIVAALVSKRFQLLEENLSATLDQVTANTRKLLLSTEGLHNHWQDYSPYASGWLKELASVIPVRLFLALRDPVEYAYSMYQQNLKNPRIGIPTYGSSLTFTEVLRDPWFAKHLDYAGFVSWWEEVVGEGKVDVLLYRKDMRTTINTYLGVEDMLWPATRQNVSLGVFGCELLRQINRLNLSDDLRAKALPHVYAIDALTPEEGGERKATSDIEVKQVWDICAPSVQRLVEKRPELSSLLESRPEI